MFVVSDPVFPLPNFCLLFSLVLILFSVPRRNISTRYNLKKVPVTEGTLFCASIGCEMFDGITWDRVTFILLE